MAFASRPRAPLLLGRLLGPVRARRWACVPAMDPRLRFAVELPDCTLAHFALGSDSAGDADASFAHPSFAHPDPRLAELLGPPGRSYSLCVPVAAGWDCGARVQAARLHQRLLHQLRRGAFQRCQLLRLLCYCPGDQIGGVQHGFLLRDPCHGPDTRRALLQLLSTCQEAERPHLGEFEADSQGALWQRLWALQEGAQLQVGCVRVVPAPEPVLHPVVPDLPNFVVFPDRDAGRAVLEEVRVIYFSSVLGDIWILLTTELDQVFSIG
jgi:UMP-CMP kinase 2